MLERLVALEDIADVWGFVADNLNRFERQSGFTLERQERDELQLEGIVILYELADRYEPHRAGYQQGGCFSGFAAAFLPKRLGDAWHRQHPEHRRVTGGDGKRGWVYLKRSVSLEEQLSSHGTGGARESQTDERAFLDAAKWTPVPLAKAA